MAPRGFDSYLSVSDGTKKTFAQEHKNDFERDDSDCNKEIDLFAQDQQLDKSFSLRKVFAAVRQQDASERLPSYLPFDIQQTTKTKPSMRRGKAHERLNNSTSSLFRDVSDTLMTLEEAEQVLGTSCPEMPDFGFSKDDNDIFDQLQQRLGKKHASKSHTTREGRSIPMSPEPTMKPSINALVTPRRSATAPVERSSRGERTKPLQLPSNPIVFADQDSEEAFCGESKDGLLMSMHQSCPTLELEPFTPTFKSSGKALKSTISGKGSLKSNKSNTSGASGSSSKENKAAPGTPHRKAKSSARDLVLGSCSEHAIRPSKSSHRGGTQRTAPDTPRKNSTKTLGLNSSCSDILATPTSAPRSKILRGRATSPAAAPRTKLLVEPTTPTRRKPRSRSVRQRRNLGGDDSAHLTVEASPRPRRSSVHSHHNQLASSSHGEIHPRKAQRSSSKTRSSSVSRRSSSKARRQQRRKSTNPLNSSLTSLTASPDQLASSSRRVKDRHRRRASAGHELLVRNIDKLKNTKTSETSTAMAALIKEDVWEKRAARQRNRSLLQA